MESSQRDQTHNSSHSLPPNNMTLPQDLGPDLFGFLQADEEEKHAKYSSFFSENGLDRDIIQVTQAEPDVCLEVFYALYSTLWPQIERQSDVSFKDAWTRFIGGSTIKGVLSPPEKLVTERRTRDIKRILSEAEGEHQIFHDLDQVVKSIFNLKQKIETHSEEIFYKKEIIASLTLIQDFYLRFRNQVKAYIQMIIEKELINASYASESDALEDLLEPKAIMMSDIFPRHWAFRIPRSQARKLLSLDMYGRNIKSNLSDPSNHRVVALPEKAPEPLVFFKANGNPPIQPEKEFMISSLYRHLQIPVPETALLVLTDVFEASPEYFYAVQASEAVIGESPLEAYRSEETIFDHEAYILQTVGAFLTNPSDGSFKNFKYSPVYQTFVSIDNDLVFKPELTGKDSKRIVNVKSILYLFPQIDLPIPESPKTFLTTLDPFLTAFAWLKDLSQKNKEYNLLFARLAFQKTRCIYQNLLPQSEVPSLTFCLQQKVSVDPELHSESFYPQILLSNNLLTDFIEKLQMVERTLLMNRSVSSQVLFEEISPVLGKYYRKLRLEFTDPEEALEALWGDKKKGVDYSYISSLLDHEELSSLLKNRIGFDESLTTPETFFKEYKGRLISEKQSPLDKFIRRHSERRKKNVLNLRMTRNELRLLVQEGLTHTQSPRDIVDFCHSLSKMIGSDHQFIKEIITLLSNLPNSELKWLLTLEKHFLRPDRHVPKDLISSSQPLLGAFLKQRIFILTESENKYLFDQQGNIRKHASLTGRSNVTCFPEKNPEFYLKQFPEWPGYEFASTLFMRLLGIQHLPYQDLIIIDSKYPAILTQKVHGDPVLRIGHNPQVLKNLDLVHTGLLIIAAMLINPEDGKEDNFILSPDGRYLIPIDNDHCFLPSTFQKEGSLWNAFTVNTALQTKTLLFCLDEMYMPIPREVRKHILSIDFDFLLHQWMTELDKIENKFNNLTEQSQRNKFLERGTIMRIPFYKQFIQSIHWKAHKIQDLLSTASEIIPFDLLKAVEPFVTRCYQNSFKQGDNLQTRFKAATDNLYKKTAVDGSRVSILNTRTMMEIINVSEKDLQNDAMFQRLGPLDALELLNQLIQERPEKLRKEQEMLCELDEKNQERTWINLFGNPPAETALKAFFASPKEGLVLKGSTLITSSRLTDLFAQAPHTGMKIRFLSLPESSSLTDKEIRILAEECPNLEYLNVSGCRKLKQIITTEGEWPLLARLEAKDCLNLEKFHSSSPMRILRIETDREIDAFAEKSILDIFAISKKTNGFEFSFRKGENLEIKSHGHVVSNHPFFLCMIRGKEEIKNFFLHFKVNLHISSVLSRESLRVFPTFLNLSSSNINIEDIQKMVQLNLINLKSLHLSQNAMIGPQSLRYLIQGDWPQLNYLSLSKNQKIRDEGIQVLSQGNWPLLETLHLSKTNISAAGVEILVKQTNWPKLKHLDLSENHQISNKGLQTLSQANWPLLETLNLNDSQISKKNFFHFILNTLWSNLEEVYFYSIGENIAKKLLRKNWHTLEVLDLSLAEITQTEIEVIVKRCNWPRLWYLNLSNQKINDEALEILCQGNWPELQVLRLENTEITKKALKNFILHANWPNLREIALPEGWSSADKNVTEIFIKKNLSQVKRLELNNCAMTLHEIETILNKYKCPRLKHLDMSHNDIPFEGISILTLADCPLLEGLHIENIKITPKGIDLIAIQSNWSLLKCLNVSNNEIYDQGLSALSCVKWSLLEELNLKSTKITSYGIEILVNKMHLPNLKKLDISENNIFNEGLKTLTSGQWPFLEHLIYYQTKVTPEETINLLGNLSVWPNFYHLEHSLNESIYNSLENLPEIILAMVPMYYKEEAMLVTVLNKTWLNSKEISLTVKGHSGEKKKTMILPLEKLDQLDNIQLSSLDASPHQSIMLPSTLKKLSLHQIFFCDEEKLPLLSVSYKQYPLMETLCFGEVCIPTKGIEILISRSEWPNLKKFDLVHVRITDEELEIFASAKWPLLEHLHLSQIEVTFEGFELFIQKSNWPLLKKLDLIWFKILNDAVDVLTSAHWPLLEYLRLATNDKGLEILTTKSDWPNLKELVISWDENQDEGLKILSQSKWPLLETLCYLNEAEQKISGKGFEALASGKWPLLKDLYLFGLGNELKDLKVLVKKASWAHLKRLSVSKNDKYDDAGIKTLKELSLEKWPSLEFKIKDDDWKVNPVLTLD